MLSLDSGRHSQPDDADGLPLDSLINSLIGSPNVAFGHPF